MNKSFILFILYSILLSCALSKMNFEKNIWVYWETDISQAPLITRVSHQKLQKAAKQAGWNYHLVTGQNIKDYLPQYEVFEDVVKRGHRQTVQQKSDILRISLIEQNGGVWIDFAAIIFDDLKWLSDDQIFKHLIINRVGKSKDDPDMFMLGQGWHQSPYSYYNEDNALVSEQYFGMAIHFVAAKKKAKIMTLWKQKMYKLCTQNFRQMLPYFLEKRLFFHNIDREDTYYSGNLALQSAIQEAQFDLDDSVTLFNPQRQNVYQHYKIWSVHGQVGPIAMTRGDVFNLPDLFVKTKSQVQMKTGRLWFYLKFPKWLRQAVQSKQSIAQKYFQRNHDLKIQEILSRGIKEQQCRLYFIVEGSIMHIHYKDSKYMNQIRTPIITVAQRNQLRDFCHQIARDIYHPNYGQMSTGMMTKPQRQLFYPYKQKWSEWLFIWKKVYSMQWNDVSRKFYQAAEALIGYLIIRNIVLLIKIIFNFIRKKLLNSNNELSPQQTIQKLKNKLNPQIIQTVEQKILNFELDNFLSIFGWIIKNIFAFLLMYLKAVMFSVNYQFYQYIQYNAILYQFQNLFLVICLNIGLDLIIWYFSKRSSAMNTFMSLQSLLKDTRILTYLPLGYVVFIHLNIYYHLSFYHAQVIICGVVLLSTLLSQIYKRNLSNQLLNKLRFIISNSHWALVTLFALYYYYKHIRFLRYNDYYAKQYLSYFILLILWTFVIITLGAIFTHLYKKIKQTNSSLPNVQQDIQNLSTNSSTQPTVDQSKQSNKFIIIYTLINAIMLFGVLYKTDYIYYEKLSEPYGFPYMQFFRFYMVFMQICVTSMRLNIKKMNRVLAISLIFIFNIFQLGYVLNGTQFIDDRNHTDQTKQNMFIWLIIVIVIVQQIKVDDDDNKYKQKKSKQANSKVQYELVQSSNTEI